MSRLRNQNKPTHCYRLVAGEKQQSFDDETLSQDNIKDIEV